MRFGWLAVSVMLTLICGGCGHMSLSNVEGSNSKAPPGTGFMTRSVVVDGTKRNYGLFVPYRYDTSRRWPVIVFLHGVLESGNDGKKNLCVGLGPSIAKKPQKFDFIAVFPQSPGDWVGEDRHRIAIACLDQVQRDFSTDPECVALTGLSNGGQGTWIIGARYSNRFSALAPMAAYSAYDEVPKLTRLPIWCVHNGGDVLVRSGGSKEMCKRIREAGGNVIYQETSGLSHNCWEEVYDEGKIFEWMKAQQRRRI